MEQELLKIVSRFSNARVAVLGDFVADVFMLGTPCRLSREAPVPILRYEGERIVPGSAGNVARNLLALGTRALCIGVLGRDEPGERLRELLRREGADVSSLLLLDRRITCTKTRIMAGDRHRAKQQVVRIDREPEEPIPESVQKALYNAVEDHLERAEALIISDYGGGVVTPEMIARAGAWAKKACVVADSRYRIAEFRGITTATPNEAEAEAAAGLSFRTIRDIETAGDELRRRLDLKALLITRGNMGMSLFQPEVPPIHIPIVGSDDVTDVTGAGDTVSAVFTLALVCGASFLQAAHLANHAAGVVVMKAGTATCSPEELRASIEKRARAPKS